MPETWSKDAFSHHAFDFLRDLLAPLQQLTSWPTLLELESLWFGAPQVRDAGQPAAPSVAVTWYEGRRFSLVPQPKKRRRGHARHEARGVDMLYDCRVNAGSIPTRENCLHDLFNVAMFRAFPKSKQSLHGRLCKILQKELPEEFRSLPGRRTREQDYLALLDEGGVLLVTQPSCTEALTYALENGADLPLDPYRGDGLLQIILFGHAHLEAIARHSLGGAPPFTLRAMPVVLSAPSPMAGPVPRDVVDDWLSEHLQDPAFRPFSRKLKGLTLGELLAAPPSQPRG